jgi:hypothetical protein
VDDLIEILEIAYVAMCKVPDAIGEDLDISAEHGNALREKLHQCLEGDGEALILFVNQIILDSE